MKTNDKRYVLAVLDTETTGLAEQEWSRVVEIAAVAIDGAGAEVSTFQSLVMPDLLDIRAEHALRINGLARSEIETGPLQACVCRDFYVWARGLAGITASGTLAVPMTAYNLKFDRVMVERMYPLNPHFEWDECLAIRAAKLMGPLGALKERIAGDPREVEGLSWLRPSLVEACAFFGVEQVEPKHRALSDARSAAKLKIAMDNF